MTILCLLKGQNTGLSIGVNHGKEERGKRGKKEGRKRAGGGGKARCRWLRVCCPFLVPMEMCARLLFGQRFSFLLFLFLLFSFPFPLLHVRFHGWLMCAWHEPLGLKTMANLSFPLSPPSFLPFNSVVSHHLSSGPPPTHQSLSVFSFRPFAPPSFHGTYFLPPAPVLRPHSTLSYHAHTHKMSPAAVPVSVSSSTTRVRRIVLLGARAVGKDDVFLSPCLTLPINGLKPKGDRIRHPRP